MSLFGPKATEQIRGQLGLNEYWDVFYGSVDAGYLDEEGLKKQLFYDEDESELLSWEEVENAIFENTKTIKLPARKFVVGLMKSGCKDTSFGIVDLKDISSLHD